MKSLMKSLLLNLHVVTAVQLQPKARVLFDDTEVKPTKTYTQEDINKSFKAGQAKAREDKETKDKMDELARLQKAEADRTEATALTDIANALKADELKDAGLNAGAIAKVANEFKDQLKGKSGKTLLAEINKIREDDSNAIYFAETTVSASNSLRDAGKGDGDKPKPTAEFYPGSTVRKRN